MEQKLSLVKYNVNVKTYNQPGDIPLAKPVNSWIATNLGDTTAEVNGIQLLPGVPGTSRGDSVTVGGNAGEEYLGPIRLTFTGAGAAPLVEIIQKYYL